MQLNEIMLIVFLFICSISIISLFIFRDKKTKVVNYPSPACDVMRWYDSDFIILAREIEQARNIYHLDTIREAIREFKYRYKGYQETISLQIDVNRLVRQWREKKITFEIRLALFN